MSSRPILTPFPVYTNADMSVNQTSKVTVIQNLSLVSYSISWAGTSPVGLIDLQVSNDYSQNMDGTVNNPGNWSSLPLSSATSVSGNSGTGFIDITENAGYALRLVYTATSGVGRMNATVVAKVA